MPSSLLLILLAFLLAKTTLVAIVIGTTFLATNFRLPFYHPAQWPFGYDSSSSLFLPDSDASAIGRLVAGIWRWDAVYFVSIADRREYVWEQEWAFGPGWPALIRFSVPWIRGFLPSSLQEKQITILTSVIVSNTCHLLALIPLYYLTRRLFPLQPSLATVTCILHVLSPAGAFLLAGNTESLFNFLSFLGMALFHSGHRFVAAIIWGFAGTVRSNALLWAGFFGWDALNEILFWVEGKRRVERGGGGQPEEFWRMMGRIVFLGGCAVISLGGFAWWQYSAWELYCTCSAPPEWCSSRLPLIYSHVQAKYWDVGFLRYWTTSQLPNFLIASPHLLPSFAAVHAHLNTHRSSYTSLLSDPLTPHILALGAMSTLLFTSMHVQIATRVLTCFPALYWYIAGKVVDDFSGVWVERPRFWQGVVKGMVAFACVGAVLYSAFLPPA